VEDQVHQSSKSLAIKEDTSPTFRGVVGSFPLC